MKGNPGKRAVNKAEAVVALSELTPPAFRATTRKSNGAVCSALYAAGLMTELDRPLAAYCAAYGRWAQAERPSTAWPPKMN